MRKLEFMALAFLIRRRRLSSLFDMILEVVKYGHPVLRQKGSRIEKITPALKRLIEDMFETMRATRGIGLAAQQVGHATQLTVIDLTVSPPVVVREGAGPTEEFA